MPVPTSMSEILYLHARTFMNLMYAFSSINKGLIHQYLASKCTSHMIKQNVKKYPAQTGPSKHKLVTGIVY